MVDLTDPVESELEDQVDLTDPVDRMDQADPMDQGQDSSGDVGEESAVVAAVVVAVVDMVDPQSAQEGIPIASTPTNLTSQHTPNTSTQISFHNGLKTFT